MDHADKRICDAILSKSVGLHRFIMDFFLYILNLFVGWRNSLL